MYDISKAVRVLISISKTRGYSMYNRQVLCLLIKLPGTEVRRGSSTELSSTCTVILGEVGVPWKVP